jgi:hypothetical protein
MPAGTMPERTKESVAAREIAAPAAGEDCQTANPPVYPGDVWGLRIWLAGAAILVFLHITEVLGRIFH